MNRDRLKETAVLVQKGVDGVEFCMKHRFYVEPDATDEWDDLFDDKPDDKTLYWRSTRHSFDNLRSRFVNNRATADLAGLIQIQFTKAPDPEYYLLASAVADWWLDLPRPYGHPDVQHFLPGKLPHQVTYGAGHVLFTMPQTYGFSSTDDATPTVVAKTLRAMADFSGDIDEQFCQYARFAKGATLVPSMIEWLETNKPEEDPGEELWD